MTIYLPAYQHSFEAYISRAFVIPKTGNVLSTLFYKPLISGYYKILLELTGYQSYIHELSIEDAQNTRHSIAKFQAIIAKLMDIKTNDKNSNLQKLLDIVYQINKKINENNYLLSLIIEAEFDNSLSIEEMLEDYYDGIEAKNRALEEKIPFDTYLKMA
jgi:hypothetical protein